MPRIGISKRLRVELNAFLKYLSVRKAKKIFVLSQQNRWEVRKLYGKDAVVVKGAFPRGILNYEPRENMKQRLGISNEKMILNINRLTQSKRVDLCIKAFGELSKRLRDVVLVIGGTGPDEQALKDLVRQLNLESRVRFVGYVDESELWDYYASCDLFVHLNLADFAIAPFEALALGKKVVCSNEMGVDQDLAGFRFLFPVAPYVEEVANLLQRALKVELSPMSPAEKSILSHYTWDNFFGEMLREMEEALD